ncbi:MAG: FliI/YscN family ATPase [Acidobacteriota bacterium]
MVDLGAWQQRLAGLSPCDIRGRVTDVTGLLIRARVPGVRLGELCTIHTPRVAQPVSAEVVGFRGSEVHLMALGEMEGIGPDSRVSPDGRTLRVPVGDGLLGRVLDGLGRPMDDLGPLRDLAGLGRAVDGAPPEPMRRRAIERPLSVGVRAVDACLTLGEGQRVGIFAGAGHGKSTLLAMMARNTAADINVIALVGERGREVLDFLRESLGEDGLARSVVVVATSDQPSLIRLKAAYVATAIAESFRDQGRRVLFLMDSVTRFARAQREAGLAAGEPPARNGFPPSVFAVLPRLLERTGNAERGSVTALYTVLVEDDELNDPIAEEVRSILDGHIVLTSSLAARGHYPAIDLLKSTSRLFSRLAVIDQEERALRLRGLLAAYDKHADLIHIGAYQEGSEPEVDEYLARRARIDAFLRQRPDEPSDLDGALTGLAETVA